MATEYQEKSQLSSETSDYSMISPKLPHSIMERVGFSYQPPKDPLEAEHEREMARSREKFRQKVVLIQVIAAMIVVLLAISVFGYLAFFQGR